MSFADSYARDVHARMQDFVGPGVQWQRALWEVGLVSALNELSAASDAVGGGVLSAKSVKWLAQSLDARAARDPGAGSGQALSRLRALLKGDLTSGGANHAELSEWADDIADHYLERWRSAVLESERPGRELVARSLTSHLIGQGFSSPALREWLTGVQEASNLSVIDLVEESVKLTTAPHETFEVLVVFQEAPAKAYPTPPEWVDAGATAAWLREHGFTGIRQHGGLLLSIQARDAHSAAVAAEAVVDRLHARAAVGSRKGLAFLPLSFVGGALQPIPRRDGRRAEVRALERQGALLQLDEGGSIDQALELLSHLNTSPDAVAAAAGWSAVESLLSAPGDEDKVVTADRLANLVACSWPRAELTTIAWERVYQTGKTPDTLAAELKALATNRERAERMLAAASSNEDIQLQRPASVLALNRMAKLARSPRDELLAVQQRAAACLRRLYRQRNLVVHGGQTAGQALATALQVAAPLVGAGLDRVTHSSLVDGRQPLELASRASFEIHRAGSHTAPSLTALLE